MTARVVYSDNGKAAFPEVPRPRGRCPDHLRTEHLGKCDVLFLEYGGRRATLVLSGLPSILFILRSVVFILKWAPRRTTDAG